MSKSKEGKEGRNTKKTAVKSLQEKRAFKIAKKAGKSDLENIKMPGKSEA